jgi:FtsP/CotA-like multicopper oxidase with cupredoxin domain
MKQYFGWVSLVILSFGLAACSSSVEAASTQMAVPVALAATTTPKATPGMEHDMDSMGSDEVMPATTPEAMPGLSQPAAPEMGHSMEPISAEGVPLATETQGGQLLPFREEAGVKVFDLTTKVVQWPLMDGVTATAYTYNGTVPGPMIRVTEGDRVRIIVKNELPEPTTIHWHGILVPNAMDGVPGITQDPIEPGDSFTYEFTAAPAGTFMYHSHFEGDKQVSLGLYAPFIIDPKTPPADPPAADVTLMLSEWRVVNGQTFAAMPLAGMEPNYFTINGKAFPNTETITVKKGQRVRLRLAAIGQSVHPMHLHGLPFKVVATDGYPVPAAAQLTKDTINVAPGERYDIEFIANKPGQWMFHCHILHHTTNDGAEPGGLMLVVNVTE